MAIIKRVRSILIWLLDLLYPRHCLGCEQEGSLLCQACWDKIEIVWPEERHIEGIGKIISMGLYRDKILQGLIQELKYNYAEELIWVLDAMTRRFIKKYPESVAESYDMIVPVPLHRRRYLERSFNQAASIARIIERATGWPVDETSLEREINNQPQAQLNDEERITNAKGIFRVKNPENFKNKNILLVDDVLTTGSTLREAAQVLQDAGAAKISAWVLARRAQ